MKITMRDIRAAKMCSRGARKFFERHDLDWSRFLKEGIELDEVEPINDAMAQRVVEVVRERR